MNLGLLAAEKNVDRQTDKQSHRQDSCFISIDIRTTTCSKIFKNKKDRLTKTKQNDNNKSGS